MRVSTFIYNVGIILFLCCDFFARTESNVPTNKDPILLKIGFEIKYFNCPTYNWEINVIPSSMVMSPFCRS